jgi:hypothetical protein
MDGGAAITLEMIAYRPLDATGPMPPVVFHHGSTGNGDDPGLFGPTYETRASPPIDRATRARPLRRWPDWSARSRTRAS